MYLTLKQIQVYLVEVKSLILGRWEYLVGVFPIQMITLTIRIQTAFLHTMNKVQAPLKKKMDKVQAFELVITLYIEHCLQHHQPLLRAANQQCLLLVGFELCNSFLRGLQGITIFAHNFVNFTRSHYQRG